MTSRIPKTLLSIETPDDERCADFFQRSDGTFGYTEYRREVESDQRWQALGSSEGVGFASLEDAQAGARDSLPWLKGVPGG